MTINLSKGQKISLTKETPSLQKVIVGLAWKPRATDGEEFDLDASAFLLSKDGKVRDASDFIFYKNLKTSDGSVEHTGDNRTGEGDGFDESINIQLPIIPQDVEKIVFAATIYDAVKRKQNFGQVAGASIALQDMTLDLETIPEGEEAAAVRYDLGEDYSTETAMLFGELYRHNGEWKFSAIGQGFAGGLADICKQYGVDAN